MTYANPFQKGMSRAELIRQVPEDGCMLVFGITNLGSWRTACNRAGMRCYVTHPTFNTHGDERVKTWDAYVTHKPRRVEIKVS